MAKKEFARECTACGKGMNEGYCIEGGIEYYCSDACLHTELTHEEYMELADDGEGNSYWTDWYDYDEDEDEDEVDTYHTRDCSVPELTAEVERLREGNKRLRAVLHDLLNTTEPTYDSRHERQAAQDALEEGNK